MKKTTKILVIVAMILSANIAYSQTDTSYRYPNGFNKDTTPGNNNWNKTDKNKYGKDTNRTNTTPRPNTDTTRTRPGTNNTNKKAKPKNQ